MLYKKSGVNVIVRFWVWAARLCSTYMAGQCGKRSGVWLVSVTSLIVVVFLTYTGVKQGGKTTRDTSVFNPDWKQQTTEDASGLFEMY